MRRPRVDLPSSEITDQKLFLRRRDFLRLGAVGAGAALVGGRAAKALQASPPGKLAKLPDVKESALSTKDEKLTKYDDITSYNNFYEFGTSKDDPAHNAGSLRTRPWHVKIEGEVAKPLELDIDDILKRFPLEERVYRMRCVEAWSMVIPWVGFPLAELVKFAQPTSKAKYVEFQSLADPEQMPGTRFKVLDWPYREGLRIDEATHPLTLLAVGLYGEVLPNQDGAPIRLVVPWKYGFKGAKSIVRIVFRESQPKTTWAEMAPDEYGFYANVNPAVDHPRWSQARERRIGQLFRIPTLPFNGYGDQVASLYAGLDPRKLY